MKPMIFRAKIATLLLKWEIILVATATVLYGEANDFSGQNSNIVAQMGNNFSSNCYCFV